MATIRDIALHYYNTGEPLPDQSGRQLNTREDVHEWLAEHGINSWDNQQMSQEVAPPELPPQARPEMSAVSGPPGAAYRRAQRAEPEPTFFGIDLPGRTLSELSDETAQLPAQGVESVRRAITEPAVEAAQELGGQALGVAEERRPQLEAALRQRSTRRAPSVASSRRPMYRGRPVAPQPPPGPTEEEVSAEVARLEAFIDSQPSTLPNGRVNQSRLIAIEDLNKLRPPEEPTPVSDWVADVSRGTGALQAAAGGAPLDEEAVSAATERIRDVGEAGASIAGNIAGAATGAVGRAAETAITKATGVDVTQLGLSEAIESDRDWVNLMARKRFEALREEEKLPESVAIPIESKFKTVEAGLEGAYRDMDKLVQERMDVDFVNNLRSDFADVMSIVPTIGALLLDIPEDEYAVDGLAPRFSAAFNRNVMAGAGFSHSAIAGLAYIVSNPWESFNTMPLSTLMTFYDIVSVAKGQAGKLSPKMQQLMDQPKFARAIDRIGVLVDENMPKVAEAIEAAKHEVSFAADLAGQARGRAGSAFRRAFGDAASNANPAAHKYGAEIVAGSTRQGRGTRAMFEQMGRLVEGDEGSTFWDTSGTLDTPFEEFDKAVSSSGAIIQPKRRDAPTGEAARAVRKGELPIGKKGGARVVAGKARRKRFSGEIESVRQELVQFLQRRSGTGKTPYSAEDINRAMSEAVSFTIPNTVLMSKTLRNRVAEDAKKWAASNEIHRGAELSGKALERFAKQVDKEVTGMAARAPIEGVTGSTNVYNLRLKLGDSTWSAMDTLMEAGSEPSLAALRKKIFAESLTALANRGAATVEQGRRRTATLQALEDYAPKSARAVRGDDGVWAFEDVPTVDGEIARIEKALKADGSLPTAFRVDPAAIADRLDERAVMSRVRGGDRSEQMIGKRQAEAVAAELRRYKKIESSGDDLNILRELGVNEAIPMGQTRRVALDPISVPGGMWVNPGTKSTLKWWAKDLAARRNTGEGANIIRAMKTNLTARRPTAHVNNVLSSMSIQGVRRGDVLLPAKLISVASRYRDYVKKPMSVSKEDREMFRAIDRTGALKTDMVIQELKALETGKEIASKGVRPYHTLERIYGWEDNVFKLEEGMRNYKWLEEMQGQIGDGQYFDLEVGAGKLARVVKKGDSWRVHQFGKGGKLGRDYALSPSKMRDLIATAAMKPALDLFFDYSDVSQIAKGIRSMPALSTFVAPFYSWYSKALTMPFAQKGIAGHMLSSRPFVRTNNPKVLTQQVADAVASGARRSFVINGARDEFIENQPMLAEVINGWGGKRVPSIIKPVVDSFNPLYFEFKNLEYQAPSQPMDALLRMIYHGVGTMHLPTLADAVMRSDVDASDGLYRPSAITDRALSAKPFPPTDDDIDRAAAKSPGKARALKVMRNIWRNTIITGAQGMSPEDAADFVGLSGSLMLDVASTMLRDGDPGKMYKTMTSLMIPGLYSAGIDVALGGAWEWAMQEGAVPEFMFDVPEVGPARVKDEYLAQRLGHKPYDERTDAFMRWAIRRSTGLGLKPVMATERHLFNQDSKGRPSAIAKSLDRMKARMRKDVSRDLSRRAGIQFGAWQRSNSDEALKAFYDAANNMERILGTKSAKTALKGIPGYSDSSSTAWVPAPHPMSGLINDEYDAMYKYITEPLGALFEKRRKRKKRRSAVKPAEEASPNVKYFTGPTGHEYFTGEGDAL